MGREQKRLHQTRRPVNQHVRVCFERCPLTTRHTAKRSDDRCGTESTRTRPHGSVTTPKLWRDCSPEAEEARSQPHSALRQERNMSGTATSQARATTTLEPTTSTRSARRERVVLVKQPADQAQHVECRARKGTWSIVQRKTRGSARERERRTREATPESGRRWREYKNQKSKANCTQKSKANCRQTSTCRNTERANPTAGTSTCRRTERAHPTAGTTRRRGGVFSQGFWKT